MVRSSCQTRSELWPSLLRYQVSLSLPLCVHSVAPSDSPCQMMPPRSLSPCAQCLSGVPPPPFKASIASSFASCPSMSAPFAPPP
ncbi:hypothetical protein XELAEV_18012328mg [Xenopus laevis]|uniref:Uncharacterized protein n=1 Tax=Xenopus laevis TaxID=8355 RepID=A0A974DPB2_XENLA|nr:hypothetical protein XELAEV_18012328mg [Xenopus laevis]